jgi:hypothetical protein
MRNWGIIKAGSLLILLFVVATTLTGCGSDVSANAIQQISQAQIVTNATSRRRQIGPSVSCNSAVTELPGGRFETENNFSCSRINLVLEVKCLASFLIIEVTSPSALQHAGSEEESGRET